MPPSGDPIVEVVDSPRLAELIAGEFWAEIAESGTPLLEPAGPGRFIATFVWRGGPRTKDVLVLANRLADRDDLAASLMHHVPGTDIWHLSYLLPSDYRGSYQLAPDEAERTAEPDNAHWQALMTEARTDPFNPVTVDTGRNGLPSSVMELPDAPEQPWWQPRGAPRGAVTEHRFRSELLGNERSFWTYEPVERTGSEPVLVLLDGNLWFPKLDFRYTLDNLIAAGAIPPVIAVGVDSIDVPTRREEMGGSELFQDFLARELLPWIHRTFDTATAPDRTIIAGQSFGGITALLTAHRHPDSFGKVLAQSPSLWKVPELIGTYAEEPRRDLHLHLSVGTYERTMVDQARELHAHCHEKGYPTSFTEYVGGHDFICWRGVLADGLQALTR